MATRFRSNSTGRICMRPKHVAWLGRCLGVVATRTGIQDATSAGSQPYTKNPYTAVVSGCVTIAGV